MDSYAKHVIVDVEKVDAEQLAQVLNLLAYTCKDENGDQIKFELPMHIAFEMAVKLIGFSCMRANKREKVPDTEFYSPAELRKKFNSPWRPNE